MAAPSTDAEQDDDQKQRQRQLVQQQQREQQATPESDEYLLSCRCESTRMVSLLLSCLASCSSSSSSTPSSLLNASISTSAFSSAFTERRKAQHQSVQPVTVCCSPSSLTFHVHGNQAKQTQASVELQASLFTHYKARPDARFSLNLSCLLECLHVLGTQHLDTTKLALSYNATTEIFSIELLEEKGLLSTALMPGLYVPNHPSHSHLPLAFRSSPVVARLLVQSDCLKDALAELEYCHAGDVCTLSFSPAGLDLAASGPYSQVFVSLPSQQSNDADHQYQNRQHQRHSTSSIVSFECQQSYTRTYPLSSFLRGMKGLDIAHETCVSLNQKGIMAIQHQVLSPQGGDPNFVDFLLVSLLQDDDDDDDQGHGDDHDNTQPQNRPPLQSQHLASTTTRPKANSRHQIFSPNYDDTTDDDDDDDDDDNRLPSVSAIAPLFGTVDAPIAPRTTTRDVRKRRRLPGTYQNTVASHSPVDTDRGDQSHSANDLLDDDDNDEPLDVTAPATPARMRLSTRSNGSESPELIYGEE